MKGGGGEEPYSSQVEVLNKIFTFNTFNLVGQTGSYRVTVTGTEDQNPFQLKKKKKNTTKQKTNQPLSL